MTTKYVISVDYGAEEYDAGDEYQAALRDYEKICANYPTKTVTLLEDEEMIKEREIPNPKGWESV